MEKTSFTDFIFRENIKAHIGDLVELMWHGLLIFIPFGMFFGLSSILIKLVALFLDISILGSLGILGILITLYAILFRSEG